MYINCALLTLNIYGSTSIVSTTAALKGGFAYVANVASISIYDTSVANTSSSSSGSFIYSLATGSYDLQRNTISCKAVAFSTNEPNLTSQIYG